MIISLFETINWPKKKKIRKFRFSSTLTFCYLFSSIFNLSNFCFDVLFDLKALL